MILDHGYVLPGMLRTDKSCQVYHKGLSYLCQEHDFSVVTQKPDEATRDM